MLQFNASHCCLLNRIADQSSDLQIKAFPFVHKDIKELDVHFIYRPTSFTGRFINISGEIPESQLLTLQLSIVRDLVTWSDEIVLLGIQAISALVSALFARVLRKPVLIISQTMPPEYERKRMVLLRVLKELTLKIATAHVAQTQATIETLTEVYGIPENIVTYAPFDGGIRI